MPRRCCPRRLRGNRRRTGSSVRPTPSRAPPAAHPGGRRPGSATSSMPCRAARLGHALEPVAPVVEPAEAAHDDGRRLAITALDIEVDRHRMPEPLQAREPQARQRLARLPRRRQRRRSLSLNDSTTIRPATDRDRRPRRPRPAIAYWVASRCIGSIRLPNRAGDGVAIEALLADHDEPALRGSRPAPGAVELVLQRAGPRPGSAGASACPSRRRNP